MSVRFKFCCWAVFLAGLLTLTFCEKAQSASAECGLSSAAFLSADKIPAITDDLDHESLLAALNKSEHYWQKQKRDRWVNFCGTRLSSQHILDSLRSFRKVLGETAPDDLGRKISEEFQVCRMNGAEDVLITGYYQPVLQASLEKKKPFLFPIYGVPGDLVKKQTTINGNKQVKLGRLVRGEVEPYWSRADIEDRQLLRGSEIAYLDDPVKVFFLHVQGSGLLQLQDGTVRSVLFAESNGLKYRSIGRLLADEGRIPLEEVSMPSITKYLYEHLDEQRRILHYNERYIFFRMGSEDGNHEVVGSMGAELTVGRSAAFDQDCFPYGIPAFLETRRPVFKGGELSGWLPLRRFVFNHDSGSAIKGPGRLDLFWGRSLEGEASAGIMKEQGSVYFFIKKQGKI